MMFDVACVGMLCTDIFARTVDALPDSGKLMLIEDMQMHLGGCAANAAIDMSRLGAKAMLVGKTGKDGFADFLRNKLSEESVDITCLVEDPSTPTASSVVTIGSTGERTVMHCAGSNAKFSLEDIDYEGISSCKIVFVAGSMILDTFDGQQTADFLKRVKDMGKTTCLDTAWDSTGQWMRKLACALPFLDWFMPSYEEAVALCDGCTDAQEQARRFQSLGAKNVVIKLGEKGCFVAPEHAEPWQTPGYKVDVVDTSGAGDSFCASFIVGLLRGWELERCARLACAVGAHCIGSVGTTKGIPNLETALAFIADHA